MADFHEVVFPEDISYGSSGGPGFNTTVIELSSGAEQRNINWSELRAKYDASHGVKTREQMEELQEFFIARRGKAFGFRFKDWMDYQITDQLIGVGTGAASLPCQAKKTYEPVSGYGFDRIIRKLVPGSVVVSVNGVINAGAVVNANTGIITPSVFVPVGHEVRIVSAEYHVPVRFDIDEMSITHDDWELMSWPSIPLVELKVR